MVEFKPATAQKFFSLLVVIAFGCGMKYWFLQYICLFLVHIESYKLSTEPFLSQVEFSIRQVKRKEQMYGCLFLVKIE